MKVTCELDYDWKDACSTHAGCKVTITGKGDPIAALIAADGDIKSETSNDAVSFVPREVNGVLVVDDKQDDALFWTTRACVQMLRKKPKTRVFNLTGGME